MGRDLHDRLPDGAYLHGARALACVAGLDTDRAWHRLTASARRELTSRAGGQIIDWVAGQADAAAEMRVWAVVLGPAGLHIATPGLAKRTWTYSAWRFQPGSLTTLTEAITAPATDAPAGDRPDRDEPLLARSLDPEFRGFLGHLPVQAQVRIQEPFHPGPDLTAFRWYLGDIGSAGQAWRFWCYLTDNTTLAFASGSRHANPAADGELTWNVTYHQAAVR